MRSTVVSYLSLVAMWNTMVGSRKLYLVLPIIVDLLLLGYFKYLNFWYGTRRAAKRFHGPCTSSLSCGLPCVSVMHNNRNFAQVAFHQPRDAEPRGGTAHPP